MLPVAGVVGLAVGLPLHLVAVGAAHGVPGRRKAFHLLRQRHLGHLTGHLRLWRARLIRRRRAIRRVELGRGYPHRVLNARRQIRDRVRRDGTVGDEVLSIAGVKGLAARLPLHLVPARAGNRRPSDEQALHRLGHHQPRHLIQRGCPWRARMIRRGRAVRRVRLRCGHAHCMPDARGQVRDRMCSDGAAGDEVLSIAGVVGRAGLPLHVVAACAANRRPSDRQALHRLGHHHPRHLIRCRRPWRAGSIRRRRTVRRVGLGRDHPHRELGSRRKIRDRVGRDAAAADRMLAVAGVVRLSAGLPLHLVAVGTIYRVPGHHQALHRFVRNHARHLARGRAVSDRHCQDGGHRVVTAAARGVRDVCAVVCGVAVLGRGDRDSLRRAPIHRAERQVRRRHLNIGIADLVMRDRYRHCHVPRGPRVQNHRIAFAVALRHRHGRLRQGQAPHVRVHRHRQCVNVGEGRSGGRGQP